MAPRGESERARAWWGQAWPGGRVCGAWVRLSVTRRSAGDIQSAASPAARPLAPRQPSSWGFGGHPSLRYSSGPRWCPQPRASSPLSRPSLRAAGLCSPRSRPSSFLPCSPACPIPCAPSREPPAPVSRPFYPSPSFPSSPPYASSLPALFLPPSLLSSPSFSTLPTLSLS